MQQVVTVTELSKRYGNVTAVDGVSFSVEEGEIVGLLGPNGAGKTTTLECMEGLKIPDGGWIDIMGENPVKNPGRLKSLIGVQLQTGSLPETLKVKEAMRLFSAYHGVAPRFGLLERLDLATSANVEYHALSTGQQRKLALALAIVHKPPVVFLDEPTAGLDVQSRVELHRMMQELRDDGVTMILSTHDMAEAEQIADRVLVLLKGRIVADGTPLDLTATADSLTRISVRTARSCIGGTDLPCVARSMVRDDYYICYSDNIGLTVAAIIARIEQQEDTLIDLRVERPSLEERFLELTKAGGSS